MAMRTLQATIVAQRVADVVRAGNDECFSCLAERHGLDEHDVRAVALVLVCRAGVDLARRRCAHCGALGELLVPRKAA
jgi:hypothetical protein